MSRSGTARATSASFKSLLITLTSDFGLSDPYVAAVKGVILGLNPNAVIIDISHSVPPQQLLSALFITQSAWPFFPPGSIHVAIVDPGVGTERRAIVLRTPQGMFLGPDNGVLSSALPDSARPPGAAPIAVALPEGHTAWAVTRARYLREPVSATFHGRDVFAPAAAHLSLGLSPSELGEPVDAITALPPLCAPRRGDGSFAGRVIHIDRFGNAITDIRAADAPQGPLTIELAGRRIPGPARTYADARTLAVVPGSSGYLEVALPNGSAAAALGLEIGVPALLRPDR